MLFTRQIHDKLTRLVTFCWLNADRDDLDKFDEIKASVSEDFKFGDKGLWLFDAMVRTSERVPHAEKA